MPKILLWTVFLILLSSCEQEKKPTPAISFIEPILREKDESIYHPPIVDTPPALPYPWQKKTDSPLPAITKNFFRCRGAWYHPLQKRAEGEETVFFYDCGGFEKSQPPSP